ncbi:Glycosyl transferases group 1 [Pseudoxanthomonas sp. GM95]|uniref:glycosyltransferase family protein n=1 Tax=Pseudoxanthomonas sp. GM95 TaxID=1881043 RepID=UPI0008B66999|nr:glycosyltransferase [Pseudoxanthomonas sp. GM95]SEM16796.1 Glycosyl transferases group 1 [Pseudoxanthomonas sp. GM95]
MADRSVLLSSNYNAWPEPFNGQAYAFLNVIDQVEDADIVTPMASPHTDGRGVNPAVGYLWKELRHRLTSQAWRRFGQPGLSNAQPVHIARDYDVFLFVCQFPLELTALQRMHGWRQRSEKAYAYMLEGWPERFPAQAQELRLLDQFDHVFVLNAESIPALRKYTSTPISFLPSACDTLLACPYPANPQRSIDVLSLGRRMPELHTKLAALAAQDGNFFYVHDVLKAGAVTDWAEHRGQSAAMIKRAKYFVAYDFTVDTTGIFKGVRKNALATRYFEGTAGGSIVLGSRQQCVEFAEHFDWEDAVIEMPPNTPDVGAFLADLSNQRERLELARATNVSQALRRHDWAHRWAQLLDMVGLPRSPRLQQRIDRLTNMANMVEVAHGAPRGVRRHDVTV